MNVKARFTYNGFNAKSAVTNAHDGPSTSRRRSSEKKATTPTTASTTVDARSTANENPNIRHNAAPYAACNTRLAAVHGRNCTLPVVHRVRVV